MQEVNKDYIKSDKRILKDILTSYLIRISTKEFGYNPTTKIKSVPLYATFVIKND